MPLNRSRVAGGVVKWVGFRVGTEWAADELDLGF